MAAARTMAVEAAGRSLVAEDRKAAGRTMAAVAADRKMAAEAAGCKMAAEVAEHSWAAEAAGR